MELKAFQQQAVQFLQFLQATMGQGVNMRRDVREENPNKTFFHGHYEELVHAGNSGRKVKTILTK